MLKRQHRKKKPQLKWFSTALTALMLCSTFVSPIQSHAISSIYVAMVLNPGQMNYVSMSLPGDRASSEGKAVDFEKLGKKDGAIYTLNTNSYTSLIGKIENRGALKVLGTLADDTASKFMFVYPKTNEIDVDNISNYLVEDLNYLIGNVLNYAADATGGSLGSTNLDERSQVLALIGAKLAVASNGGDAATFDVQKDLKFINIKENKTITVKFGKAAAKSIPNTNTASIEDSYYKKATLSGGAKAKSYTVLTRIARTLHSLQVSNKITASTTGWTEIVASANGLYYNEEVTYSEIDKVTKPGLIEQELTEMGANLLNGVRSMLNLKTMDEMMFNTGKWAADSWYGIAPLRWIDSAIVLFYINLFLAVIVLGGSIITLLMKRNLATINPSVRVSLIDGFKNIVITGFVLAFAFPAISIFASLNESLVAVFASGSIYNELGMSNILTGYGLPGIVLDFFFLLAEVYYNAIYILRGVAVCLLIGIAPLMIVGLAYGKVTRSFFTNWLKELIGNITIQAFHALFLTFFGFYGSYAGSGGMFEQFVLVIALIPMSKLFKSLTGMGESDFASQAATQAKNVVGTSILIGGAKKAGKAMDKFAAPGKNWANEKAGDMLGKAASRSPIANSVYTANQWRNEYSDEGMKEKRKAKR